MVWLTSLKRNASYVQVLVAGVLTLLWLVTSVASECNVCQSNEVACINSTSFNLCFGYGKPHVEQVYHCPSGLVCTQYLAICLQENSNRKPSCGETSKCGRCSAHRNNVFACLSRGIAQMCYGADRPRGNHVICPTNTVCDANSDDVCVPKETVTELTCDVNDALVASTTARPGTTTTESSLTSLQVCQKENRIGLFETSPRDAYCKRYIECYFTEGVIQALDHTCPATTYFEADLQRCSIVSPRPSNCL